MDMLDQFFAMGGYAHYVWPAYAVAALVLAGMAAQSYRAWQRQHRQWSVFEASRLQRRR
jgi:heme exporter protein D